MLMKASQFVVEPGQPFVAARVYSRTCLKGPTGPMIGVGGSTGTPSAGSGQNCYTVPLYGPASSGSGSGPAEGGATGSTVIGYTLICNGQVTGTYTYG